MSICQTIQRHKKSANAVNFQPTVTPTQIYYTGDNGFGYQYEMANMNFGDSYTEVQGNNQIPNQTPETYFQSQRQEFKELELPLFYVSKRSTA